MIIMAVGLLLFSSAAYASCTEDCYKEDIDDSIFKWTNDVILNTSYQDITSEYHDLGKSNDSIFMAKVDWMSHLKIYDRFGITSTVRALRREYSSDIDNKYPAGNHFGPSGNVTGDLNEIQDKEYSDAHFRALYISYILPEIGEYRHMGAFGTMPFQGGAWTNYKIGGPQEATGMNTLFDMPFDAAVYVGDISSMVDADLFQFRLGHGTFMKFRDYYPQDKNLMNVGDFDSLEVYGTNITFLNFDYRKDVHNIKFEVYQTDWMLEGVDVGLTRQAGLGYAYDRMEDEGYVLYGTLAKSYAKGNYTSMISQRLNADRDLIIGGSAQQLMAANPGLDFATASSMVTPTVDANLANVTPQFVSSVTGLTLDDIGILEEHSGGGWAIKLGAKKEHWFSDYDVTWFGGAEYFRSSQNWLPTTLRGFPRHGIDPTIKGQAFDIYTGLKFDDGKVLTISWVREDRKWAPASVNEVMGVDPDDSHRNLLEKRDIFRIDFTWFFLGI